MKLQAILEDHADANMDVRTVDGGLVSANSWTIGDEVVEGHIGKKGAGGYSVYVVLEQIVSVKVY